MTTINKMKHTPTPWSVEESGYTQSKIYGCDSAGKVVFSTVDVLKETPEQEANAEFIVTACNAHEDLVKALKYMNHIDPEEGYCICPQKSGDRDKLHSSVCRDAFLALAKAGVKP